MIIKLLSEQIQGRLVRERILPVTELSPEEWAAESIAHLQRSNTMGEVLRAKQCQASINYVKLWKVGEPRA